MPRQKSTELLDLGEVKIGVIGLTTLETPTSSKGFTNHLFPDYQFLPYKEVVIEKSN